MYKVFSFIIELIYWVLIFLSPFLISAVISCIIYFTNENLLWLSILILTSGFIFGVIYAERIRKKYGCSKFMGRILATPDIWPDEEKSKEDNKKTNV